MRDAYKSGAESLHCYKAAAAMYRQIADETLKQERVAIAGNAIGLVWASGCIYDKTKRLAFHARLRT